MISRQKPARASRPLIARLTWPELMRLIRLHQPCPGRQLLEAEAARREQRRRPAGNGLRITITKPSRLNSSPL